MIDPDKLYKSLIDLTYSYKFDGKTYDTHVVNMDAKDIFKTGLYNALKDQEVETETRVLALEAKIDIYERFISRSNFSPFISRYTLDPSEILTDDLICLRGVLERADTEYPTLDDRELQALRRVIFSIKEEV